MSVKIFLTKILLLFTLLLAFSKEPVAAQEQSADFPDSSSPIAGYPVLGVHKDTLFIIYSKFGESRPRDRAAAITERIEQLYRDNFLDIDNIICVESHDAVDIICGDILIMSLSEHDAKWEESTPAELAEKYAQLIKNEISYAKEQNKLSTILKRVGLILLVVLITLLAFWLIKRGFDASLHFIEFRKDKWLKNLAYKDYTFLTADQEYKIIVFLIKPLRYILYALVLYISLPAIFSIFPFTRSWATYLFGLIWRPFREIMVSVWEYLPNLFTILAIYFVMKYFIRFVKYIFSEIDSGKLNIAGFHKDWAMPTFQIIRFLLYAFMFVLIFPNLPGSDSDIFKGVSVFVGVLFSLGSSTAIANMVAGLVITYMRPFKIGDRIKIGDVFGDVEEKTMLVTRIKTLKNEVITIPNSAILSGNTINYTIGTENDGLILHTNVTIGYEIHWKYAYETLIEAAKRTPYVLESPQPFVLQVSLDDFYVVYQINVYVKEMKKQSVVTTLLHQNIQDVCAERDIELLSPHYRAERDGNQKRIPPHSIP